VTPEELDRLEAVAKAATPGPWWVEQCSLDYPQPEGSIGYCLKYRWDDVPTWLAESSVHANSKATFDFIASANPATVLALIALCRTQSARIAEMEGVVAMFTLPEPNPEEDDSQCVLCHSTMHIRDGDEPTPTCDHCAQDLVSKARATLAAGGAS
jgi:hypothetical protein